MEKVPTDALLLYLWQNRRTVVIGKNQNAWAECDVNRVMADGGFVARRLSGGGCVYHDEQNLNFSFLAAKDAYDPDVQTRIILEAVKSFGIDARQTGRNDLVVDGRKFSGNAYYEKDGKCLHHGTVLINTDTDAMNRYLRVSAAKLESNGVSSVRSRVVNLKELNSTVTVANMKEELLTAAANVCGLQPEPLTLEESDQSAILALVEKYSSWEWIYGRKILFTWSRQARFPWGDAELRLTVNQGIIEEATIYSDAMDSCFIELFREKLIGTRFGRLSEADLGDMTGLQAQMFSDLQSLLT